MCLTRKGFLYALAAGLFMLNTVSAKAQESTKVVVRAVAKDAKFIGSSMGGALITIKNAKTGEVLGKGLTKGSTGSTEKLVKSPKKRYEKISTEGSAKFTAHLKIDEPVYVTISATSTYRNSKEVTSSTQMWLIPGMDINGDGIVLELPGFVVDIIKLQSYKANKLEVPSKLKLAIEFKVKVVMMCGCSTKPGGLWDSSKFKMKAFIKNDGEVLKTVPLSFSGKTNIYEGRFIVEQAGRYTITAIAFDPRTANSGLATKTITLK